MDWLVDEEGEVWLLEVNAFPDFGQTGGELMDVVKGVWEGVVRVAVRGFFRVEGDAKEDAEGEEERMSGMRKVLDVDMGRG